MATSVYFKCNVSLKFTEAVGDPSGCLLAADSPWMEASLTMRCVQCVQCFFGMQVKY